MPFLAQEQYPISTKDILTWSFENDTYDQDEPIYIDAISPKNSISANQGRKLVRLLAAGFHALGMQKGDCVCINSFNDIHYPMFFLGVIAAGGVFAGVNPGYTPYELVHTLRIAKVKYVLVMPSVLQGTLVACKEVGISADRIIIFNPNGEEAPAGYRQWKDLLSHGERDWARFDDLATAKSTPAGRFFSSGTTGLPKAADLSHYNLIAQHTLVYDADARPWKARRLHALPMFHVAIAPMAFTSTFRNGEKAFVLPRFEGERWLAAHEKYEITDLYMVPPMAIFLINTPLTNKYSLKSVRVGYVGAAPLDKQPQARVQALLGKEVAFAQVWGMTESSCIAFRFPWSESDDTGGVGRPIPSLDFKVVDEDGKDVSGTDARGELCIRGPTVFSGYFENPEANARDFDQEGFFHTGDIAYVDGKTGIVYIVDRKKELIKVRAFQVAPAEVEGVLLAHPDIVDAAVVGIPDPDNPQASELPRAYVVRRDGQSEKSDTNEVLRWTEDRLASYKQPLGGIVFVDAIPKTASGKILKRILREQAKKEMGAKL